MQVGNADEGVRQDMAVRIKPVFLCRSPSGLGFFQCLARSHARGSSGPGLPVWMFLVCSDKEDPSFFAVKTKLADGFQVEEVGDGYAVIKV